MTAVRLQGLSKRFGNVTAVDSVDLSIASGEFVVLVGPSGSGKTTCLRMIAGLETVTSGSIFIGERDVANIYAKDRNVAMVFQSYALYPHMTVAQNMGFALKLRKVPPLYPQAKWNRRNPPSRQRRRRLKPAPRRCSPKHRLSKAARHPVRCGRMLRRVFAVLRASSVPRAYALSR